MAICNEPTNIRNTVKSTTKVTMYYQIINILRFFSNRGEMRVPENEIEEACQQNYARQVHFKSLDTLCLAINQYGPFLIRANRLYAAGPRGQFPQSGIMANDASALKGFTRNNSKKRKFGPAFDSEDSEASATPLSFDEKCQLSSDFGKLSSAKLRVVIQILKSREPIMRDLDSYGMVIDFERLMPSTLRELESFVASCLGEKTDTMH